MSYKLYGYVCQRETLFSLFTILPYFSRSHSDNVIGVNLNCIVREMKVKVRMRKRDRKLIYYDDDQWTIVVQNNITNQVFSNCSTFLLPCSQLPAQPLPFLSLIMGTYLFGRHISIKLEIKQILALRQRSLKFFIFIFLKNLRNKFKKDKIYFLIS